MKTLPKYEDIVHEPRPIALPEPSRGTPNICLVRHTRHCWARAVCVLTRWLDFKQVLDLDETLVHCSVDDVENPHLQFPVSQ